MRKPQLDTGFSLLELALASAILSVGTLAVFTLFLHWRGAIDTQETRYQALQQTVLERPNSMYVRHFEVFSCERELD